MKEFLADLELSRRLERAEGQACKAFVEARAKTSPESGAQWIEEAGTYAMYDGVASPVTQTFGLGMFQTIEPKHLERLERFFQEKGAPVFHEVSPLAGLGLATLLNERGYRPMEFTSVMHRRLDLGNTSASPPEERIRVRRIGPEEMDRWIETTAQGWSEHPEAADYLRASGPIFRERSDLVAFLADLDGQTIAAAALAVNDGVAVLAGAATIPQGRRQGAQLALLHARLRHAAKQGCDLAMMCALPGSASQRNAERHGFRIAYTRIKWQLSRGTPQ